MLDNPILQDKRVRQALVYAIDRETINQRLFEGRQTVAHSDVSPLDWVYNEDVKKYPYDPAKAAELLDAAGWSELRGGIRHHAQGEPPARKRVVWGKSASVGVDHGGGRIITKKKKTQRK